MQIVGMMKAETLAVTHEQSLTDAQKNNTVWRKNLWVPRVRDNIFLDGDWRLFHA